MGLRGNALIQQSDASQRAITRFVEPAGGLAMLYGPLQRKPVGLRVDGATGLVDRRGSIEFRAAFVPAAEPAQYERPIGPQMRDGDMVTIALRLGARDQPRIDRGDIGSPASFQIDVSLLTDDIARVVMNRRTEPLVESQRTLKVGLRLRTAVRAA